MSKFQKSLLLVFILLIIDQLIKILVKTNMAEGEVIPVFGTWFKLHYVENKGMAFGFQFGGDTGKLILSLFRIVAVIGITWYMLILARKNYPNIVMVCVSLILAGAMGNIIDSAFYGLIFGEASFLHGAVVDMFYFPLFSGTYPDWFPFVGGKSFTFFNAIFNFADACITIGVIMFIIFRKKFVHPKQEELTATKEIN